MTQLVSAERAAALRNKCLNLTKTCRLGSGSASERTSQSRQLMSPMAHFGHGAMSDLSPLCASKRMSANGRVYEPSPTRTASWQLSARGFEGLNSSCGRFAPNQSHCAPAATKQPVGQIFAAHKI